MDDFFLYILDDKFLKLCSEIDYYIKLEEEQWEWEVEYEIRENKGSE